MFTEFEFTPWLLGGAVVLSLAAGVRILSGPHEAPSAPALPSKEGFGAQVYDSFATFLNWPTASTSWFNWGLWGSDSTEYADAAQRLVLALLRSIDAEPSVVIDVGCGAGDQLAVHRRAHPKAVLIGVTPTAAQAAKARHISRSLTGTVHVLHSTAEQCSEAVAPLLLPTPSGSGVVLSVDAAYHFATRRSFLEQSHMWLASVGPGGSVGLVDIAVAPSGPGTGPDGETAWAPDGCHHQPLAWTSREQGTPLDTMVQNLRDLLPGFCPGGLRPVPSPSEAHPHPQPGQLTRSIGTALGIHPANFWYPWDFIAHLHAAGFASVAVVDITAHTWPGFVSWAVTRQAPALLRAGHLLGAASMLGVAGAVAGVLAHGYAFRVVLVVGVAA